MYVEACMCMYVCMHVCIYVCALDPVQIQSTTGHSFDLYIYICTYVYMYICTFVYIYTYIPGCVCVRVCCIVYMCARCCSSLLPGEGQQRERGLKNSSVHTYTQCNTHAHKQLTLCTFFFNGTQRTHTHSLSPPHPDDDAQTPSSRPSASPLGERRGGRP